MTPPDSSFDPRGEITPEQLQTILLNAKNEWEGTFDAIPDAVAILDGDRRIIRANAALAARLGMEYREIVGRKYCELARPLASDNCDCGLEEMIGSDATRFREMYEEKLGGWVLLTTSPMRDKSGERIGTVLVTRDISQRKRMETELRASEEKFRALVETIPDGILIVERGRIVFANQHASELFGMEHGSLPGRTPAGLIAESDRERFSAVVSDFLSDNVSPGRFEVRISTSSGLRVAWTRMRRIPASESDTAPFLLALADITREYQAREQLRRTQANLVNSQRLAKLGSWTHDLRDNTVEWSSEMYRLLSLPRRLAPSEDLLFSLMASEDVRRIHQLRQATEPGRDRFASEVQLTCRDVEQVMICMYHEDVEFDSAGKPVVRSGVLQDVTDLRDLERQLAMASRLESVGTLAGGIGHDFNNLLTGITTGVSLARADAASGDLSGVVRELSRIEDAATQAGNLARQLLVFSKGSEPVRSAVALRGVVEEALSLACRGSSIEVMLNSPQAELMVHGDRGQLYQVFFNLILNGRDALEGRPAPRLEVALEHHISERGVALHGRPRESMRVVVSDNGEGVPEEIIERVFDPFFSTKGSSGLGLAVCQRIVRNHNGDIRIESRRNAGTRVIVDLPPATQTQLELSLREAVSTLEPGGDVLVMDDEELILAAYERLLGHLGFTLCAVGSGNEAIRAYQEAMKGPVGFRCVLLDLTVRGGLGGDLAAQEILRIDPKARVILSSGYSENPILSRYSEYGIRAVLAKPFSLAGLREALAKALA